MTRGITRLGALRVADRAQWAREVAMAMRSAHNQIPRAAENLGVSTRTLMRWLAELPDVYRAPPGRPRKST